MFAVWMLAASGCVLGAEPEEVVADSHGAPLASPSPSPSASPSCEADSVQALEILPEQCPSKLVWEEIQRLAREKGLSDEDALGMYRAYRRGYSGNGGGCSGLNAFCSVIGCGLGGAGIFKVWKCNDIARALGCSGYE